MKKWFFLLALVISAICFADYDAGFEAYNKGDFLKAKKEWELVAEQKGETNSANNVQSEAQYALSSLYWEGKGVKQDYAIAKKWAELAANAGHVDAQFKLGYLYLMGLGVKQNYSEAIKWFEKSANQGHVEAQYNLGMMYYQGFGVTKNIELSRKWLLLAEKQGDQLATKQLTEIDAFHQFNTAIDSNNSVPVDEAARTEEVLAAKQDVTRKQEKYSIPEPEVIVQKQPAPIPEPELIVQKQPSSIPEPDIIAQKQATPKPEQVVIAQKQASPKPEQVIIAQKQATPKPEQVIIAQKQATPKPEQVAIAQKQSTPKPEQVIIAQKQASPKPEQVIIAQKQASPKPEQVIIAQKQASPKPEQVIIAQKQASPKPEQVIIAQKQATPKPEQVIIAQKQNVSRPESQTHNANVQQETLVAEVSNKTHVGSESEHKAKEKTNNNIQRAERSKRGVNQQPAEHESQRAVAYESHVRHNKSQQGNKLGKLPSTELASTQAVGNETKINNNFQHNINPSEIPAVKTAVKQKPVIAKINILPATPKVKAIKLQNSVEIQAKVPLATPKASNEQAEKSVAVNTGAIVADQNPVKENIQNLAGNQAINSTEIAAENADVQTVVQNKSTGLAPEANAIQAQNDYKKQVAAIESSSSSLKPEQNPVKSNVATSQEQADVKTTPSEEHSPKTFLAICAVVIAVIVCLFMWLRIRALSRKNLDLEEARRNIKHSLNSAKERVYKIQEELNLNVEQVNKEKQIARNEAQRALAFETQLNEHNVQLVDIIQKLAAKFKLDERLMLIAENINSDILWQIQNEVITLVIERLETEQNTKVELQQAYQTEAAKLAEKETLLDLLKSQMDLQSRDFVKLKQGLDLQLVDLQQQFDNNKNELSSALKKLEAEQSGYRAQEAKLAEKEVLVENLQGRLDAHTNQAAKNEQELKQQIATLKQQLDDSQKELSNTVTRFRDEQALFLEETRKRAEKEKNFEAMQAQLNTQKDQFANIEQEHNQQIALLQQQLDSTKNVLSDTMEKFNTEQANYQAEATKLAEKEVLFEAMQDQMDAQNDRFAKIEQEREQQIALLEQQLDSTHVVLSDTMEKYQAEQLIYQAEVIKRAEKEAFLEALQARIDTQTGQFAKMELELKEQKTMLKQQLDNTQRVLSDSLEKQQLPQMNLDEEEAKRAEKEALFDTLQTIMDTQNNQFAKLEQELEQQQAILQQQQDNIQKVLTDNQDLEIERAALAEEESASKPSFFDAMINGLNNLFGGK